MKTILRLTILLGAFSILFSSCSKTHNEVKMIPSDALMILHLKPKSLTAKLSWDDIKQTGWFKQLYNDTAVKGWTKNLMDNPSGSGIDFDEALVIFVQKTTADNGQIVFEGDIKDVGAFEAFNKNLGENATTIKDGEIKMISLDGETIVGWSDKKFAYVMNGPNLPGNMNTQSTTSNPPLTQVCKKLFALSTDSSMAKSDRFSSLLKEEGDVHIWQNTEAMVNSSSRMGAMSMLKLDALLKGSISTGTAGFDNGRITVKQKSYTSPELTDLLKKYRGEKINTDMIKNIPSQNIDALLAINFKPEGLKKIIELTGLDGFVNSFLSRQGITIDDFVKANKGDIIVALTDFKMEKDSFNFKNQVSEDTSYTYNKPSFNYLFSVSIGDKPSFDKLVAAAKKIGIDFTDNAGIYFAGNEKVFAIGKPHQYVSQYLAGSNNKFDFINKIADYPIAFFVDIQKILISSSSIMQPKDSSAKIVLDESLKTWQNIFSMGGEYKNDAFIMNTEINLVDKNVNSLKQLNTYFDRISKVIIEKKKKYEQGLLRDDSSAMYPPMNNVDTVPVTN